MTLGANYATTAELKTRITQTVSTFDTQLGEALSVASRAVDRYCGRQFNVAGSATARVYFPDSCERASVDDISTTSGLIIATDAGDDGTYETTWATGDYFLEPLNGVVDGETGWPYSEIVTVGTKTFPVTGRRPSLQVTATWGWAAVPAAVKEATLIMAEHTFKLKDAPWGVAGVDAYGLVRVRENPEACKILAPYRRNPILVG